MKERAISKEADPVAIGSAAFGLPLGSALGRSLLWRYRSQSRDERIKRAELILVVSLACIALPHNLSLDIE